MSWVEDHNQSQEVLDTLLLDVLKVANKKCPDCGVAPGKLHTPGCDVARCLECGGQRLSCDCNDDKGYGDIWIGLWPGTINCYEYGLVSHWEGNEKWGRKGLGFCHNSEAVLDKSIAKKVCSFSDFLKRYKTGVPSYMKRAVVEDHGKRKIILDPEKGSDLE